MLPPSFTRAPGGAAHARTVSAASFAVRRTGPSPVPSAASNGKEQAIPHALSAAARRASAAPRLGAPVSTGVKRALPATSAPVATARPGHARQSLSVSSAPRTNAGATRPLDRAFPGKAAGLSGKVSVAGAKRGRQELEDKVRLP